MVAVTESFSDSDRTAKIFWLNDPLLVTGNLLHKEIKMGKDKKQYIENLLSHLIGKNHYYEDVLLRFGPLKFTEHVKMDLLVNDVEKMSPKKLGEIMCSFEIGGVPVSKKELFENLHFCGDCEDFLRELVATCLAYAIANRVVPGF